MPTQHLSYCILEIHLTQYIASKYVLNDCINVNGCLLLLLLFGEKLLFLFNVDLIENNQKDSSV